MGKADVGADGTLGFFCLFVCLLDATGPQRNECATQSDQELNSKRKRENDVHAYLGVPVVPLV